MFRRKKRTRKQTPAPVGRHQPSDTIATLSELKKVQENIEKRAVFLGKKADLQKKQALKAHGEGRKDQALLHMKRKNLYEKQIKQAMSSSLLLDEQILAIESGSTTHDIANALKMARIALRKLNAMMNPDDVSELVDNVRDLSEITSEAAGLLVPASDPLEEEEEMMKELAYLEDPHLPSDAKKVAVSSAKPSNDQEARDLEMLDGWLKLPKPPVSKKPISDPEATLEQLESSQDSITALPKKPAASIKAQQRHDQEEADLAELKALAETGFTPRRKSKPKSQVKASGAIQLLADLEQLSPPKSTPKTDEEALAMLEATF